MFVRKKRNNSEVISVQIIDKSSGKYTLVKTNGSSSISIEISRLVSKGEDYINKITGIQELDFNNYDNIYKNVA